MISYHPKFNFVKNQNFMAISIIWCTVCLLFILYKIDSRLQEKKAKKNAFMDASQRAGDLLNKLRESSHKFARENNKIGVKRYDIEEGGKYVNSLDEKDIAKVDAIIMKHNTGIKSENQELFYKAYFNLRFNVDLIKRINTDILNLPEARNNYIGF
jgi:hypothetical protein